MKPKLEIEYKVSPENSTINGESSKGYNWNKFNWHGGMKTEQASWYDLKWSVVWR